MLPIRHRLCLLMLAVFALLAQLVQAAVFTVDSLADSADINAGDGLCDDGSGACSLRTAIEEANALGGADTIGFSVSGTIILSSGLPSISQPLTITGPGAKQLTVSGNHSVRPFYIGNTSVTLSAITIRDGVAAGGYGGGIYCPGSPSLTISHSTLHGNSATSLGGGIYCGGATLTITNSTLSGNTASSAGGASGGGIYVYTGTVTITNSTFSGNAATSTSSAAATGGGIFVYTGSVTITNSTITANSATSTSGSAGEGGGLAFLSSGSVNLANSIVAGNVADQSRNCYVPGVLNSHHSIEDANTCGLIGTGDRVNTDPLLEVLDDYGGPTRVHYLSPGSPAIDTGDDEVCPATDQRGLNRPQDGDFDGVAHCDMGAAEFSSSDGIDPHIQVLPQELDFGTVSGDGVVEKTIYVLNDGKLSLTLGTVGLTDPLAPPFSIHADSCSDKVFPPGAFCTLTVRLDPATAPVAMLLGVSASGLFLIGMLTTSRRYKKEYLVLYLIAAMLGALLTACGGGGTTVTDYTGSFDIPSNDPDTAAVIVNVKTSIEK